MHDTVCVHVCVHDNYTLLFMFVWQIEDGEGKI